MKRTLLFFSSALVAGALTGYLVSEFPQSHRLMDEPSGSVRSYFASRGHSSWQQSRPVQTVAKAWESVMSHFHDQPKIAKPSSTVLLRESVVVIQGGQPTGASLPAGTSVEVLKEEGRYVQVQYDHRVITIPRSAIVAGVSRTN